MHTEDLPEPPVALVTGASRGIGRVTALLLAARGMAVCVNYRTSSDEADDVVQEIVARGGRAIAISADMSIREQASQVIHETERLLGPLYMLVNNAGITRDRLLIQMHEEDWDATWNLDLDGSRRAARTALELMKRRQKGRIVNISSVVGATGNAGQANYAAAKSAVHGLTRELALAGAPHNITCNCVVPGYVKTDATSHLTEDQQSVWLHRIPMRRAGTEMDMAEAVAYFGSEAARYVTGQCLAVDGGLLASAGCGFAS